MSSKTQKQKFSGKQLALYCVMSGLFGVTLSSAFFADMLKKTQTDLTREHNKSEQRAVHIKYLTTGELPAEYFNDTLQRMSQKIK